MNKHRYCQAPGRKIDPSECGSFNDCPALDGCDLRKLYGWDTVPAKPKPEPAKPEQNHECNMCHKSLDAINFRKRKDGKGRKKTCFECEDKYISKEKPTTPRKKAGNSVTAKPAPKKENPAPRPPPFPKEKPAGLDLSGFTKLQNNFSNKAPALKIKPREVVLNAEARRRFASLLKGSQTMDVYHKPGDPTQLVLVPFTSQSGEYRVYTGKAKKAEYKIYISLGARGFDLPHGPHNLQEVDGMLLAEITTDDKEAS